MAELSLDPEPQGGTVSLDPEPVQPSAPAKKPGILSALGRFIANPMPDVWEGEKESVTGMVKGLSELPGQAAAAPQGWSDWASYFKKRPGQALKDLGGATLEFGKGMIPFQETLGQIATGTKPDLKTLAKGATDLAVGYGVPSVGGSMLKRGVRGLVKELPGAGAATHEIAIPKVTALPETFRPTSGAVNAAYAVADSFGDSKVTMTKLREAAADIVHDEETSTKPDAGLISQANRILESSRDGWDWKNAEKETRRIGEQFGSAKKTGSEKIREIERLYGALREDMEAPAGNRSPAFKDAQRLARRNFAADELADTINKNLGRSSYGFETVDTNGIVKWIDRQQRAAKLSHPDLHAKRFVGSFEPGELDNIKASLLEIGKDTRSITSKFGTPQGSSQRVLHAALGTIVGGATGGGAGAAEVGASTVLAGEFLSQLLMSDGGRSLVRAAIKIDPTMGPTFVHTAAGFLRAQSAEAKSVRTE